MTKPMGIRRATRVAAALGLLSFACVGAMLATTGWANDGSRFDSLAGRWAGEGVLTPVSGPRENFKCVVTYFPSEDGAKVRQNLRCRGSARNFDAATHLNIVKGRVTGDWQENVHSLNGSVNGMVTANGFEVVLSGRFFEAQMSVVSSACEQSVTITPRSSDMKELAATLKKC